MSLSSSYVFTALVLLARLVDASPAPALTTVTLYGVSNSFEPTPTGPEMHRFTGVAETRKYLGVDDEGSTTYEIKYRLEDIMFTGEGDVATYTGGDEGFSTRTSSMTNTVVRGPMGYVQELSGTPVFSCAYSVGGEGTCVFVQYPVATTVAWTYSGPTQPEATLEVDDESGDIRVLGLNEEDEGEGGEGEGGDGEGNGDEGGNGGEDEQGAAPVVGASLGLAIAATLASGSALLFF